MYGTVRTITLREFIHIATLMQTAVLALTRCISPSVLRTITHTMSLPATAITGMASLMMSQALTLMTTANLAPVALTSTLCISLLTMAHTKVSRLPPVIATYGMG